MGKSGIFLAAILFASAQALAANVDHLNVTNQDGSTVVSLSGQYNSVAAEIFSALNQAGLPETDQIAGHRLSGKLVQATVFYLNGAVYEASFTLDSASSYGLLPNRCAPVTACPNRSARLFIGGDVAAELFSDLEKAGDPETRGIDSGVVRGKAVVCSYQIAGGVRYSCSLTLSSRIASGVASAAAH